MSDQDPRSPLEEDVCIHIFTVSAAMVGVCLTVIGLLRIVITVGNSDTFADDLLAMDAILFLSSCLLSYWALRTRNIKRMHRVERVADSVFIAAMVLMVVVCGFVTFAITQHVPPAHAGVTTAPQSDGRILALNIRTASLAAAVRVSTPSLARIFRT